MKRLYTYLIVLQFLFLPLTGYCNGENAKEFRRCYIIAYEAFDIFNDLQMELQNERGVSKLEDMTIKLFTGSNPLASVKDLYIATYPYQNIHEDFFDPRRDEIIFYNFGGVDVNGSGNGSTIVYENSGMKRTIDNIFRMQGRYSDYASGPVSSFLSNQIGQVPTSYKHTYPDRDTYVSMTGVVYPTILSALPDNLIAEEYYLLIFSKLENSSSKGNKTDAVNLRRFRKVLVDNLLNKVFVLPIMDLSFKVGSDNKAVFPGLLCYRIKPALGNKIGDDLGAVVNKQSGLTETAYQSSKFKLDSVSLLFSHKQDMVIDSTIIRRIECAGEFIDTCSLKLNNHYKKEDNRYTFFPTILSLDKVDSTSNVKISYTFRTTQTLIKENDFQKNIGYIFPVSFNVGRGQIIMAAAPIPPNPNPYLVYQIACCVLILLVLLVLCLGTAHKIKTSFKGINDKFKEIVNCKVSQIDYYNSTREHPNAILEILSSFRAVSPVFGMVNPFQTHIKVGVECIQGNRDAFDIQLFRTDNIEVLPQNQFFYIKNAQYNTLKEFSIKLNFKQTDNVNFKNNRYQFKVRVEQLCKRKFLHIQINPIKDIQEYTFEIGENLGHVWVAFDPGTNGSSVAIGASKDNIHMVQVDQGNGQSEPIVDSVILFNNNIDVDKPIHRLVPQEDYSYGYAAKGDRITANKIRKYRSIKKLLGFDDKLNVPIRNRKIQCTGKEIASLLIKGIYRDAKNYVFSTNNQPGYLNKRERTAIMDDEGEFNPKRAVVAVPNNFTLKKIQDMVDTIKALNQFKEVLYLYEAEAVLFAYMNEKSRKESIDRNFYDNKQFIVFDMGGATINASVFRVRREITTRELGGDHFHIETVSRIGYGIGGDSIDFCLINMILSIPEVEKALRINSPDAKQRYRTEKAEELIQLIERIKPTIIANMKDQEEALLLPHAILTAHINAALGCDIESIDPSTCKSFRKNALNQGEINNIVYANVIDSIRELCALPFDKEIPTVLLFSGRTTLFPFIRSKVEEALRNNKIGGMNKITVEDVLSKENIQAYKTIVAEGACYYVLQRHLMTLHNDKTFYSFGYIEKDQFVPMINPGDTFDAAGKIKQSKEVHSFLSSNRLAQFYQIIGSNPNESYSKQVKHKLIPITNIHSPNVVFTGLNIRLDSTDEVICCATIENQSNPIRGNGDSEPREIANENEEHYIFAALRNNH